MAQVPSNFRKKDFPEILNEALSYDNSQEQPTSKENKCTPNKNRSQYNTEKNNRTRILTMPSPSATHKNRVHGFQNII